MPIVNGGKDSAEQKVTKCHVLWEVRTPYHDSDNGFNFTAGAITKTKTIWIIKIYGGGKDSAEQKVTKCHVLREVRTPYHDSDNGFNFTADAITKTKTI